MQLDPGLLPNQSVGSPQAVCHTYGGASAFLAERSTLVRDRGPRFPMSSRGLSILTLHSTPRAAGHESGATKSDRPPHWHSRTSWNSRAAEGPAPPPNPPSRQPRHRTARPHRPGTPHSESARRPLASRAHHQPRTYVNHCAGALPAQRETPRPARPPGTAARRSGGRGSSPTSRGRAELVAVDSSTRVVRVLCDSSLYTVS